MRAPDLPTHRFYCAQATRYFAPAVRDRLWAALLHRLEHPPQQKLPV